jgi:hypothetical protein
MAEKLLGTASTTAVGMSTAKIIAIIVAVVIVTSGIVAGIVVATKKPNTVDVPDSIPAVGSWSTCTTKPSNKYVYEHECEMDENNECIIDEGSGLTIPLMEEVWVGKYNYYYEKNDVTDNGITDTLDPNEAKLDSEGYKIIARTGNINDPLKKQIYTTGSKAPVINLVIEYLPKPKLDMNGFPIYKLDEAGNKIELLDPVSGMPILEYQPGFKYRKITKVENIPNFALFDHNFVLDDNGLPSLIDDPPTISKSVNYYDMEPCNIDCDVSEYGEYGECDPLSGLQSRSRVVLTGQYHDGAECPALTEEQACAVDCITSDWVDDGECIDGVQSQTREWNGYITQNGGLECTDLGEDGNPLLTRNKPGGCPVNCTTGDWTDDDAGCINGVQHQTRSWDGVMAQNGGTICTDLGEDGKPLMSRDVVGCPIHGGWSDWSNGDPTSLTCDPTNGDSITTSRTCDNPSVMNGGNPCVGDHTYTKDCPQCGIDQGIWVNDVIEDDGTGTNTWRQKLVRADPNDECDIDSKYGSQIYDNVDGVWSEYDDSGINGISTCDRINAGTYDETRTCTGQEYGGLPCVGSDTKEMNCPVDCVMSEWDIKPGSTCDKNTGKILYSRNILTQSSNGGTECPVLTEEERGCDVDCEMTDWVDSGAYMIDEAAGINSDVCGNSLETDTKQQSREVIYEAKHGGAQCYEADGVTLSNTILERTVPGQIMECTEFGAEPFYLVSKSGKFLHASVPGNGVYTTVFSFSNTPQKLSTFIDGKLTFGSDYVMNNWENKLYPTSLQTASTWTYENGTLRNGNRILDASVTGYSPKLPFTTAGSTGDQFQWYGYRYVQVPVDEVGHWGEPYGECDLDTLTQSQTWIVDTPASGGGSVYTGSDPGKSCIDPNGFKWKGIIIKGIPPYAGPHFNYHEIELYDENGTIISPGTLYAEQSSGYGQPNNVPINSNQELEGGYPRRLIDGDKTGKSLTATGDTNQWTTVTVPTSTYLSKIMLYGPIYTPPNDSGWIATNNIAHRFIGQSIYLIDLSGNEIYIGKVHINGSTNLNLVNNSSNGYSTITINTQIPKP